MRLFISLAIMSLGSPVASETISTSIDLYVIMETKMEWGPSVNNPKLSKQWDLGKGFSSKSKCESYLVSAVMEDYHILEKTKHTKDLVVNSYWSNSKVIGQQWQCVNIAVFKDLFE